MAKPDKFGPFQNEIPNCPICKKAGNIIWQIGLVMKVKCRSRQRHIYFVETYAIAQPPVKYKKKKAC